MLGDTASFPCSNIRMSDGIQKGGLSMVHMTKDGHDRRARREGCLVFTGNRLAPQWHFASLFFDWSVLVFQCGFKTHFISQNGSGVEINRLVDAGHDPIAH